MKINFTYGPNVQNADEFDVGPATFTRDEAMTLAFAIMTHYTPPAVRKISPHDIEHMAHELIERVPHGTNEGRHG